MKNTSAKTPPRRRRVLFTLGDQRATEVTVSGDFNQWHRTSHPMKNDGNGTWQKIMLLPPGQYEYKFLVDGQWRTDPNNPTQCLNRFGTHNNVLRVQGKDS